MKYILARWRRGAAHRCLADHARQAKQLTVTVSEVAFRGGAIAQMDEVTRRNAALVEEAAAASEWGEPYSGLRAAVCPNSIRLASSLTVGSVLISAARA